MSAAGAAGAGLLSVFDSDFDSPLDSPLDSDLDSDFPLDPVLRRRIPALAVIGHVPAGTFELQGRHRNQSFQLTAALVMHFQGFVGKPLANLESLTTPVTLVIVKWHIR